ncbi:hypothetical protein Dsin_020176 [Dipteronia sinensis]|uniref:RNase H type-1 domain-containing protein n=1 Tax=Dipteronia sinensis TaxID=43782 RepID=A0AAE0A8P9_9ROSI|nr:hypothetical protein Dsin_020176 [Dipteronia sinensis]
MNTDAALNASNDRVDFGIIIRDHTGGVMASSSQFVVAGFPLETTEAMAIFRGLEFARDSGLLPCTMKSDAQGILNLINSRAAPFLEVRLIINDIIISLDSHPDCSVVFAPIG